MASLTPLVAHKEDRHIRRGKRVDASLTSPLTQNENTYIHKGKGVENVKVGLTQPGKAVHQERKALRDLTNATTKTRPSAQKEKVAPPLSRGTNKKKILTGDKEVEVWATEGIEKMDYFNVHKFENDRVRDWCFSELFPSPSKLPLSQCSKVPLAGEDNLKMKIDLKMTGEDALKMDPSSCPVPRRPRPNATILHSILGDEECYDLCCEDLYFNKAYEGSLFRLKEEENEVGR